MFRDTLLTHLALYCALAGHATFFGEIIRGQLPAGRVQHTAICLGVLVTIFPVVAFEFLNPSRWISEERARRLHHLAGLLIMFQTALAVVCLLLLPAPASWKFAFGAMIIGLLPCRDVLGVSDDTSGGDTDGREIVEIPAAHKEELDRRVAAYDADPTAGSTWEEVKARLRGRS